MDRRIIWLAVGSFTMSTVGFVFSSLLRRSLPTRTRPFPCGAPDHAVLAFLCHGAPLLSALAGAADRRRLLVAAMLVFVVGNCIAADERLLHHAAARPDRDGNGKRTVFAATAQATRFHCRPGAPPPLAISIVVGAPHSRWRSARPSAR